MYLKTRLIILNSLISFSLIAQSTIPINFGVPQELVRTNSLPDDLLSTKCVAIISVKNGINAYIRDQWQEIAEEAHKTFYRTGLDVVSYYFEEDFFAGHEVAGSLSANFKSRGIRNLIILEKKIQESRPIQKTGYRVIITPFSEKESFVDYGQIAWTNSDTTLTNTLLPIYREAARISKKTNLLIAESPEYYDDVGIIKGKRFEQFPVDLRVLKLAVPSLPNYPISNGTPELLKKEVIAINNENQVRTSKMESLLKTLAIKAEIVQPNVTDQQLTEKGFRFSLYFVQTRGENVRKILDYKDLPQDAYVSISYDAGKERIKTIEAQRPVYKFYIKQIVTGDVYLGSRWDAGESWNEAITNFLSNLKKDLDL